MTVPKYGELPRNEALGLPQAWDVWGREDNLGTLNHLTPGRVSSAATQIQTGERFALSLPAELLAPPLFGRQPMRRTMFAATRNDWDESYDSVFPQAGSQWDGLLHVRAREQGFYTGFTEDPTDAGDRLGIEHWAHGITGRGVLLDLDVPQPLTAAPVGAEHLRWAAAAQGVEICPGDILCLRFGWTGAYRALDASGRAGYAARPAFAGLAGSEEIAELLWDWNVAAVVADNPAIEVAPGDPAVGSLHRRLLPMLGFALGELFDLDDLASACRRDARWTFFFVGVPHRVRGSLASAANAIALR